MVLYHFTTEKGLKSILKERRLRLSHFKNVNDPFELHSVSLGNPRTRSNYRKAISKLSDRYAFVCFSENRSNPLLWAHYADNSRGACLAFEIAEEKVVKMRYLSKRIHSEITTENAERLLAVKFKHWIYEQERRMVVDLSNKTPKEKSECFLDFDVDIMLDEIYLGYKCVARPNDVKDMFNSIGNKVAVKVMRPAFRDFRMVLNRSIRTVYI